MAWCEMNRVDFVFGLAQNPRLVKEIAVELWQAEAEASLAGKPARRFKDFRYSTLDSWSRKRRVIGKAEWTEGEANPRFIVTSLSQAATDGRVFSMRRSTAPARRAAGPPRFGPELAAYEDRDAERDRAAASLAISKGLPCRGASALSWLIARRKSFSACMARYSTARLAVPVHLLIMTFPVS